MSPWKYIYSGNLKLKNTLLEWHHNNTAMWITSLKKKIKKYIAIHFKAFLFSKKKIIRFFLRAPQPHREICLPRPHQRRERHIIYSQILLYPLVNGAKHLNKYGINMKYFIPKICMIVMQSCRQNRAQKSIKSKLKIYIFMKISRKRPIRYAVFYLKLNK